MPRRPGIQAQLDAIVQTVPAGPACANAYRQLVRELQREIGETSDLQRKYHLSVLGRHVERLMHDQTRR